MPELVASAKPKVHLVDPDWVLRGPEDDLYMEHSMDITDDFMDRVKDTRFEMGKTREGEYMEVCEVPAMVVEKWLKEGFDVMKEPAKAIIRRLSAENLGNFISTSKMI